MDRHSGYSRQTHYRVDDSRHSACPQRAHITSKAISALCAAEPQNKIELASLPPVPAIVSG